MKSILAGLCLWGSIAWGQANLNDLPAVLAVPAASEGSATAGLRVKAVTSGWEGTAVHHTIYLPADWKPGAAPLPVIAEYPGNGGYANKLGDASDGTVEGCMLGYGLSGGRGFIWISLPFVEPDDKGWRNALRWWGDVAETKRYCMATVQEVCRRYGGDPSRVVLMGFSRGAIACNYIGLHDASIARLWCGFLCHSHYEGEFKHPAPDQASWPERLRRLGGRPQFISQEQPDGTSKTRMAIKQAEVRGQFTFASLPFPNHSARWTLCDLPLRQQAREWLLQVTKTGSVPPR